MPTRRYAPALSKEKFKAVRPGGNYQTYLRYLKSKRPGWDINRPGVQQTYRPPVQQAPAPTYASLLQALKFETPAQIEARANRMANQQISASQKLIAGEYADAEKEARRRQESFQAAGRAAAAMNAELMGQVGGAYTDAAQGTKALGGALGAAMSGATAADVAAANSSLGGLGPGTPGVNVPEGQAAVEVFRGATLPADQLTRSGVAQEMGIGTLISAQNLRATQEASAAYQNAVGQARSARQAAVRELTLGRPQAAAGYLAQLQEAQRQQVALAMSLIGQRKAAQQQAFSQGMTKAQFNQAVKQQKFSQSMTTKQFNQALRQQGISNAQWQKSFAEKQREYGEDLAFRKSESAKQARQFQKSLAASGKKGTPAAYVGSVLANLGESSYDPKFQNAIASIYYSQPSPAGKQPVRGSKDERQRTNAVISYLMSVYWPNVSAMVTNPKVKAQLRKGFENQLRAWWASAPLPGLQAWKLSALKG